MRSILALGLAAACSTQPAAPPPVADPIPTRLRLVTDVQYANAIRELLGDVKPVFAVRTPGTRAHQFHHDDLVAVDAALLSQYRVSAESIAREVAQRPFACAGGDVECARVSIIDLAERAFRRPLEGEELDQLVALYAMEPTGGAGWANVVEAVLQAPSFVYRSERGDDGAGVTPLTPWELTAELAFWLLDSLPDDELRATARDGSILRTDVLAHQVERLLADPRVQARIDDMILEWFEIHHVFEVPEQVEGALRQSMFDESARFVHDVLWRRGGSLATLLTSNETVIDQRLATHYGLAIDGEVARISHDPAQRAGILTHASVLSNNGKYRVSTIKRGVFIHRTLLCTEELGRPPFVAITEVSNITANLSDSQFAHYRAADLYCSGCHRTIDPPGRALLAFDRLGVWRARDEKDVAIESDTRIELDGTVHAISSALDLAHLLAGSDQVARCVVDQFTHHAFGARLSDAATRDYLHDRFVDSDRNLVDLIRAIATSPAFRMRGAP